MNDSEVNEQTPSNEVDIDLSAFQHKPFISEEHKVRAITFSDEHLQYLQNLLAETAVKLVNEPVDPNNVQGYACSKAFYLGQVRAYEALILNHKINLQCTKTNY